MMAGSVSAAGSVGAAAGACACAKRGEAVMRSGIRRSDFFFIEGQKLASGASVVEGGFTSESGLWNGG